MTKIFNNPMTYENRLSELQNIIRLADLTTKRTQLAIFLERENALLLARPGEAARSPLADSAKRELMAMNQDVPAFTLS